MSERRTQSCPAASSLTIGSKEESFHSLALLAGQRAGSRGPYWEGDAGLLPLHKGQWRRLLCESGDYGGCVEQHWVPWGPSDLSQVPPVGLARAPRVSWSSVIG